MPKKFLYENENYQAAKNFKFRGTYMKQRCQIMKPIFPSVSYSQENIYLYSSKERKKESKKKCIYLNHMSRKT